jgi:hypothetical protein
MRNKPYTSEAAEDIVLDNSLIVCCLEGRQELLLRDVVDPTPHEALDFCTICSFQGCKAAHIERLQEV